MPDSEPPALPALRPAGTLLLRLLVLASGLWLTGYALATPRVTWNLYRLAFDDTVGHRLGGKLAALRARGGSTVLVLGASTAREGFDEQALADLCPGHSFFNGGLAGGSVDTLAVAALMLRESGARPTLAVLALHPWMLRSMDQDLVARGYSDFFDRRSADELLRYQYPGEGYTAAQEALRLNTLWPPARHARQLGRLLRAGLLRAHGRLYWGRSLERSAFEVVGNDTQPIAPYKFSEKLGEGHDAMIRRWERQGFLDPGAYSKPELAERFDRALRLIEAHAQRVAVVVMPEHTYLREHVAPLAEQPFRAQLRAAQARGVQVFEHASSLPDGAFCDLAHVNAEGRAALSRAVAPELRALLEAP